MSKRIGLVVAAVAAAMLLSADAVRAAEQSDIDELRSNASNLRQLAARVTDAPTGLDRARHWEQLAKFMFQEATLRERAKTVAGEAKALQKQGKAEEAERREVQAESLNAAALETLAQRKERERIFETRERRRQQLKQLNERAYSLRTEGRFDLADEIDREIRDMLLGKDPELRRVHDLKQRAARARLDGDHADAEMHGREAARLLENVKRRYPYRPEVNRNVDALYTAAEVLEAAGLVEEAHRLLRRAGALTNERHQDPSASQRARESNEELRRLRNDVVRLNARVKELAETVELLLSRELEK